MVAAKFFKKGDRVVLATGTHALIYKVLRGGNAAWYEILVNDSPRMLTTPKVNVQRYEKDDHGEWKGPKSLD